MENLRMPASYATLPDEELPETAGEFVRVRDYRYGKILLTAYRHQSMV